MYCIYPIGKIVQYPADSKLKITSIFANGDFDVMYLDLSTADVDKVTFQLVYADGKHESIKV